MDRGKPLPHVEVVDMKKEEGLLSEKVKAALQKNTRKRNRASFSSTGGDLPISFSALIAASPLNARIAV